MTNLSPDRRTHIFTASPDGFEISDGNTLNVRAQSHLRMIRAIQDETQQKELLANSLIGSYGGDEQKGWLLHHMTEGEREIALSNVGQKDAQRYLDIIPEILARDKAASERIEDRAKSAQPKLGDLTSALAESVEKREEDSFAQKLIFKTKVFLRGLLSSRK